LENRGNVRERAAIGARGDARDGRRPREAWTTRARRVDAFLLMINLCLET
jgi:hypothetical protein